MIENFVRVRTSRRSGAEYEISLRKRRQWFADDPDKDKGSGSSDGTQNTEDSQPENRVPQSRFNEVVAARNAAEAELKKFRDAAAAAEQQEALKKGEFEKVIGDLKPKAERADALEKTLKEYLDAEIADIPEDMRSLVPQGDVTAQLSWVKQAKGRGLFTKKPVAPPMDGGERGDGGGNSSVKLTPEQKETARKAGMTEDQFAKAFAITNKPG